MATVTIDAIAKKHTKSSDTLQDAWDNDIFKADGGRET